MGRQNGRVRNGAYRQSGLPSLRDDSASSKRGSSLYSELSELSNTYDARRCTRHLPDSDPDSTGRSTKCRCSASAVFFTVWDCSMQILDVSELPDIGALSGVVGRFWQLSGLSELRAADEPVAVTLGGFCPGSKPAAAE